MLVSILNTARGMYLGFAGRKPISLAPFNVFRVAIWNESGMRSRSTSIILACGRYRAVWSCGGECWVHDFTMPSPSFTKDSFYTRNGNERWYLSILTYDSRYMLCYSAAGSCRGERAWSLDHSMQSACEGPAHLTVSLLVPTSGSKGRRRWFCTPAAATKGRYTTSREGGLSLQTLNLVELSLCGRNGRPELCVVAKRGAR